MMNRKSNFTLIELIVVIVVLGILAAIVIPNISSFQKEARDAQLTADARNIQTALDMYRAKSASGQDEPTLDTHTFTATDGLEKVDGEYVSKTLATPEKFELIKLGELTPKFLRKTPSYVVNAKVEAAAAPAAPATGFTVTELNAIDVDADKAGVQAIDYNKGQVLAGVLQSGDESAAVVKFVSVVDGAITVVR